jgi:anti-anti-sigma factor
MTTHQKVTLPLELGVGGGDVAVTCPSIDLRVRVQPHAVVVMFRGEIDASNADCVTEHIQSFLSPERLLVVDFSQVLYCAAAGLQALVDLDALCHRTRVPWTLVPSRAVQRLLSLDLVDRPIRVSPSVSDAVYGTKILRHPHPPQTKA